MASSTEVRERILSMFEGSGRRVGSGAVPEAGPHRKKSIGALSELGIAASPELLAYCAAAEEKTVREAVSGLVASGEWNVHPVRPLRSVLFHASPSHTVSFLAGLEPIAEDPDSGAVLAASWAIGEETSAVVSFLFDDVSPADAEPGDFVVEGASILAFLEAGVASEDGSAARPKASSAACVALQRRYRETIWIAQLVYDRELWTCEDAVDDVVRAARDARPLTCFARDLDSLGERPDLAAGWLLAHAVAGRAGELATTIARTETSVHPAVMELRKKLTPKKSGTPRIDALLGEHCSHLDADELAAIREAVRGAGAPEASRRGRRRAIR